MPFIDPPEQHVVVPAITTGAPPTTTAQPTAQDSPLQSPLSLLLNAHVKANSTGLGKPTGVWSIAPESVMQSRTYRCTSAPANPQWLGIAQSVYAQSTVELTVTLSVRFHPLSVAAIQITLGLTSSSGAPSTVQSSLTPPPTRIQPTPAYALLPIDGTAPTPPNVISTAQNIFMHMHIKMGWTVFAIVLTPGIWKGFAAKSRANRVRRHPFRKMAKAASARTTSTGVITLAISIVALSPSQPTSFSPILAPAQVRTAGTQQR